MGIVLSLAIHNHQPVGNFAHVFEEAYARSYRPMLQALQRHPRIRVALHYSGPLLDWLEGAHPEFFPMLRGLVERGQVELMSGGYYEPILAVIPGPDRAGQIRKMTAYLHRRFGVRPRGLWLAERVWEPQLARAIAEAGCAYTIVDDAHFVAAGLREEALVGRFVTEDEGAVLTVFPSLQALRYLIPWKPVPDVLAFLRRRAGEPPPVLLMGDDGEKFGMWPGTYAHCWEDGWVDAFFTALEAAADWLTVAPPAELLARPAAGRVYLPTASYSEMEAWALPAEAGAEYGEIRRRMEEREDPAGRYLRGGFWRQFLVKYPEINTLHKKMLRVSRKVWAMPPGRARRRALEALWQAQCNCPYWHGVFGGAYLPHIRRANFARLIAAEALADRARRPRAAEAADLDADGDAEIELNAPSMVLWVDPAEGGGVVAWDWRAAQVNLVNVMTRRREAYHRQLLEPAAAAASGELETIHTPRLRVKEQGLDRLLTVDPYRRASFLDHVVAADAPPAALPDEPGFAAARYTVEGIWSPSHPAVSLAREGRPAPAGPVEVRVRKRFEVDPREPVLRVRYEVASTGGDPARLLFGVETNWGITDPSSPVRCDDAAAPAGQARTADGVRRIEFTDAGWPAPAALVVPPAAVALEPILTVSNSEGGLERTFQGLTCVCWWRLALEPGERRALRLEARLSP